MQVRDVAWCAEESCVKVYGLDATRVCNYLKHEYGIDVIPPTAGEANTNGAEQAQQQEEQPVADEVANNDHDQQPEGAADERRNPKRKREDEEDETQIEDGTVQGQQLAEGGDSNPLALSEEAQRGYAACEAVLNTIYAIRMHLLDDSSEEEYEKNKTRAAALKDERGSAKHHVANMLHKNCKTTEIVQFVADQIGILTPEIDNVRKTGMPRVVTHFDQEVPVYANEYKVSQDLILFLRELGGYFGGSFSGVAETYIQAVLAAPPRFQFSH